MYGLNALALAFFMGISVAAYKLSKCQALKRTRILRGLCLSLLVGNTFRYAVSYPFFAGEIRIPAEFSTVAYFIVPIILLFNLKRSQSWAAYSGLMAGFFYYMAAIVLGGRIYAEYPPYDIYISMFCHGVLYLCGLVTIGTRPWPSKDGYRLALGIACVAVRALLLRPYVIGAENMFIYMLLDGDLIKWLFPKTLWAALLPVYYGVAILLVLLTIRSFYKLSHRQYKRLASLRGSEAVI